MLSHDNLIFEASAVLALVPFIAERKEQERLVSYLPLSHAAGINLDIVAPVVVTALRPGWLTVHFARPYDLKAGTLGERLKAVRPTIFLGIVSTGVPCLASCITLCIL
jgi:long-subunit acyl-CoA synthetase (AMP-forming)